jgi:hypothetical protein
MVVSLQVRDVPEDVRDTLVAAAKAQGKSLQAYLLGMLIEEAHITANRAIFADLARSRHPLDIDEVVGMIREDRERDGEGGPRTLPTA